jgi:hypothetical protein
MTTPQKSKGSGGLQPSPSETVKEETTAADSKKHNTRSSARRVPLSSSRDLSPDHVHTDKCGTVITMMGTNEEELDRIRAQMELRPGWRFGPKQVLEFPASSDSSSSSSSAAATAATAADDTKTKATQSEKQVGI